MAGELVAFGNRIDQIVSPSATKRIAEAAGKAAKAAALNAAARSLGGDRRFSGYGKSSALDAEYDPEGSTGGHLNFRPSGPWALADKGRRRSGIILPKTGEAVLTPQGPRARASYGPSRGLGTVRDAMSEAGREVPEAAARQFHDEIAKVMR